MDIINRASRIVDELVVGVLNNSAKNSLFSLEERVSMIEEMTKDIPNVTVASFDGLLVEFMNKIDASIIVRGLRAVTDFEFDNCQGICVLRWRYFQLCTGTFY